MLVSVGKFKQVILAPPTAVPVPLSPARYIKGASGDEAALISLRPASLSPGSRRHLE